MTAINTLLLQNCSSNATASVCLVSSWMMSQRLHPPKCKPASENISCYAAGGVEGPGKRPPLLAWSDLATMGCSNLFSSVAVGGDGASDFASLELGTVELGWWLDGGCDLCDRNASCRTVSRNVTPSVDGVVCTCKHGFDGDGFKAGSGCRRGTHNSHQPTPPLPPFLPPNQRMRSPLPGGQPVHVRLTGGVGAKCWIAHEEARLG